MVTSELPITKSADKPAEKILTVLYMNCRSMMNKLDHIEATTTCYDPDILLLCETWTHSEISNAEIQFPNYSLVTRKDRQDTSSGKGGGLVIYVKIDITAQ